jgi:CubicO group peptidase (beta-lactamase class C family)
VTPKNFFPKLKRRDVYKVVLAYAIVAVSVAADDSAELNRKVDQLFAACDKPDTPGCVLGVIRDGNFVYKRGYGMGSLELRIPLTPESVFYMGSVSKQFTAASVMLAAEQGYLSLDDDVRKYIPELPSYGQTIALRQMLHHTSGLRDLVTLLPLSGRNWEDLHPFTELLDLVTHQRSLNYKPGDEYLYSNTNYFLLAEIVHRATGKSLSRFAEENIFKPLGMTQTRFYDDHSVIVPGRVSAYAPREGGGFRVNWSTNFDTAGPGGLMSTVDDLLLWDRNFYANKLGKGTLLQEIQSQGVLNNGERIDYAMGLLVSSYRGLPIVEHGGSFFGYRTELLRFPDQKFSVICLCNLSTSNPSGLAHQVADIYLKDSFHDEHAAVVTSREDPKAFTGIYRNAEEHSVVEVAAVKDGVRVRQNVFQLVGPNRFAAIRGRWEVRFDPLKDGAMRMALSAPFLAKPQVFERFQPIKIPAEELAQYAGEYVSDELQTTYKLAVKDGKLTLANKWQKPSVVEPSARDEFQGPNDSAIVFRRDAAGRITGCEVFAGRVRTIAFAKK